MAYPTKSQIPVAVNTRSDINLSAPHITTSDFLQLGVAKAVELKETQTLKGTHRIFTRLAPMPVPTFGRARISTSQIWVPYRTIMPSWNDFHNDTPHVYDDGTVAIVPNTPIFTHNKLRECFLRDEYSTVVFNVTGTARFDFETFDTNGDREFRVFTPLGRFSYKIMRSLGYGFQLQCATQTIDSCLPIFALCKAYIDWMYPSQYANDSVSSYIQSLFTNDRISPTVSRLESGDFDKIFTMLYYVTYEPDYFVSAWDNPTGPNNGLSSGISIQDFTYLDHSNGASIDVTNDYGPDNYYGTPVIHDSANSTPAKISQYSLNALHAMSDYLKRNQLAGSRAIDRALARYGVKLSSEALNRSVLINSYSQDIEFSDVLSTASTDNAVLGDYAGRGLSLGRGDVDFDAGQDVGLFLIVSTIVPDVNYFQGAQRYTKHISRLDFLTPEYDGLGVQALAKYELFTPLSLPPVEGEGPIPTSARWSDYYNQIFGFTSRYAEDKIPYAQLTGDYVLNSSNVGKDAWNLMRYIDVPNMGELRNLVHSPEFVQTMDRNQYMRIFTNTLDNADHFNVIHWFDLSSSYPGHGLYDTYEFKDEDKSKKVTMDVGGTTIR